MTACFRNLLRSLVRPALAFVIVAALSGCAVPFPNKYVFAPELAGRVHDGRTGAPVPDVRIDWRFEGRTRSGHVVTTTDGSFRIPEQKAWQCCIQLGDYWPEPHELRISHPAYGEHVLRYSAKWFSPERLRIALTSEGVSVEEVNDDISNR